MYSLRGNSLNSRRGGGEQRIRARREMLRTRWPPIVSHEVTTFDFHLFMPMAGGSSRREAGAVPPSLSHSGISDC